MWGLTAPYTTNLRMQTNATYTNYTYRLLHYLRCTTQCLAYNRRVGVLGRCRIRCKVWLLGTNYRHYSPVDRCHIYNNWFLFNIV